MVEVIFSYYFGICDSRARIVYCISLSVRTRSCTLPLPHTRGRLRPDIYILFKLTKLPQADPDGTDWGISVEDCCSYWVTTGEMS